MDAFSELPSIRASELTGKATTFAYELAAELDALNQQYPTAEMSPKEKEFLEKTFGGNIPGPVPQQFIPVFERLFFAYMASRYVIVPDQS
jgi:hypothetical protein